MKEQAVIVIVESGLLQTGFRHILKSFQPENSILFKNSVEDCLNGKTCPRYMIVESKLIPQPVCYTLEKLKNKNPDGNILILETSTLDESAATYAKDIIAVADTEEIINKKLKGFFENSLTQKSNQHDDSISEREKEIVRLVALGKTNKEISEELFISPHTVITHRKNLTAKLGIKTIAGLTVYAILNGLIDKEEL